MVLNDIWPIFINSFPSNERRTFIEQEKLFESKYYRCKVYKEVNEVKAFICYWEFKNFIYVEHLAVNNKYRGDGLGSKIIEDVKNNNLPIVLEVEPIDKNDYDTKRRIKFYEGNGFKFNDFFYEQPPLNDDSHYLELKIMSYPHNLNSEEFEEVKEVLLKYVY